MSDRVTKEVRFKLTFNGSYRSRRFNTGRDFIPGLGRTVVEGTLTKLAIREWVLKTLLVVRARSL